MSRPFGTSSGDRSALRQVLRARYPFVEETEYGPRAVAAGECDRCAAEPRMVQPCGPPPDDLVVQATADWALGRRCAHEVGPDGWCGGHEDDATAALQWLATLPPEADDVARLWWVATGEIRPDPVVLAHAAALLADNPIT